MDVEPTQVRPQVRPPDPPPPPPPPPVAPASPSAPRSPAVSADATTPSAETSAHTRARVTADPAATQLRTRAEAAIPRTTADEDRARLAASPAFGALPEARRTQTQDLLTRHADDPAARRTITRTAESPGFGRLEAGSQERLMTLLGGTNGDLSGPARRHFDRELDRTARLPADQQADRFEKFLRDQPHRPELIAGEGNPNGAGPVRYGDTTRERRSPFDRRPAPGVRGDVEIDMSRTPVVTPERSHDRRYPAITRQEIGEGLRALPDSARRSVTEVYSNPREHDEGAFGTADEESRRLDIFPGPEARRNGNLPATVSHEVGHTLAFQRLGRDFETGAGQAYRDAIRSDRLSPSQYAGSSEHEDFAETFALYIKHRGTPREQEVREMFPARMRVIDWAIQSDPTGVVEHGGYR